MFDYLSRRSLSIYKWCSSSQRFWIEALFSPAETEMLIFLLWDQTHFLPCVLRLNRCGKSFETNRLVIFLFVYQFFSVHIVHCDKNTSPTGFTKIKTHHFFWLRATIAFDDSRFSLLIQNIKQTERCNHWNDLIGE